MVAPAEPTTLVLPTTPRSRRVRRVTGGRVFLALILILGLSAAGLWAKGVRPADFWGGGGETYRTISIGQGEVRVLVTESGNLESAANAMVKCQVEAILGTVGGAQAGMNGQGGMGNNRAGGMQGGGSSVTGANNAAPAQPVATKAAATTGTAKAGTAGAAGTTKAGAAGSGATATAAAAASAAAASGGGGGGGVARPNIQSFTMVITPHTPLRPATAAGAAQKKANTGMGQGMGGQGGGGGNRGGQQDPMGLQAGSTKVLKLVAEGTQVKADEIVCELDSAPFRDELQAQLIRWQQAKSWVEQAREILKVSQIALREYRDGIYPQDRQQIEKYIQICQTQLAQSQADLKWSIDMDSQGLISPSQLSATRYAEQRSRIVLNEAKGMRRRLIDYTGPKLLKNLEAKISAVQADLLAQESSFQLEDDRRRKLQKMIDLCTLRAPRDGLVAYASTTSGPGWNPNTVPMQEGTTVRQGQTIILLPDSNKMRVKVRVNESKVSQVYSGQKAAIQIEAFPDRPLTGTVTEITAIPAPANGPVSDVKLYYANVAIDEGGFEGLRPGLSAQVAFFVDARRDVTKIPLDAIRWADGEPFAAIPRPDGRGFDWRPLELGLMGRSEAEVVSGLKPGDRVIAHPDELPAPSANARRIRTSVALGAPKADAGS